MTQIKQTKQDDRCIVYVGDLVKGEGFTFFGVFDNPELAQKFMDEEVDQSLWSNWEYLTPPPIHDDNDPVGISIPQFKLLKARAMEAEVSEVSVGV